MAGSAGYGRGAKVALIVLGIAVAIRVALMIFS